MTLPAFFDDTLFDLDPLPAQFPRTFAIVTAWATTGETWSEARNRTADAQLFRWIETHQLPHHRVTGWAPLPERGVHAEPGWAIALGREEAKRLGDDFAQLAVWWVAGDRLELVACRTDESRFVTPGFSGRCRRLPLSQHE